ncbi:MAG TPA: M20/M25/M40 family metallo-hydrolase [Planctomycetaceae bacterium]|jgi:acetylornithine deacetylase/succinyl-diaminopimelate desuccinylase-like protein
MPLSTEVVQRLRSLVNRERLVRTVVDLVNIPSKTGEAGAVLDRLGTLLAEEGFRVERPAGGHPSAPAVAVRLDSGRPGKTLQFNGHLDTVHLPFVPAHVEGDHITGSGSCDMKGGTAAAVEALRVLRDSGEFKAGSVLFTAHDLHEAPWGDGRQLEGMIREGYVGDAVLIPEYMNAVIPVVGRGLATWKITVRREGAPVHEVMRPATEPSVIDAAAELIARVRQYGGHLAGRTDPEAGCETVFIGQVHAGEIFNQFPQECWLEGTRRWLPGVSRQEVEQEFRGLVQQVANRTKTTIDIEWFPVRDGFQLDRTDPFVGIFQEAHAAASEGRALPFGAKPFCDDCNTFWELAKIPGITHGPNASGAHTLNEWVSIDDLVRVAHLYALTAVSFCGA